MYIPTLARFASRDPLNDNKQDLLYPTPLVDPYRYVRNNPLRYVDPSGELCFCPFKLNTGKLFIDCSCQGVPMWLIPEDGTPAFTPKCGQWYDADGFYVLGQLYKIDGSTCVNIDCNTSNLFTCCVNFLAACLLKTCAYPVPSGTFGNEPPPGTPPSPIESDEDDASNGIAR